MNTLGESYDTAKHYCLASLLDNYRPCETCPSQQYHDPVNYNCLCRTCSTTCSYGYKISEQCNQDHDLICVPCLICEVGKYNPNGCPGRCDPCPAGKYRSDLNAFGCSDCKICDLTQRQRRSVCGVSDSTCVACDAGHIVSGDSLDLCYSCTQTPGTFARASDNTCAGCRDCQRNQGVVTPCQATADRTCADCSNNKRSYSTLNGNCDGCEAGYVRAINECLPCESMAPTKAVCGSSQYIKCVTEDTMGKRNCLFCEGHDHASSTKCQVGYGVSVYCTGTGLDVVTCTACPAGTERPGGTAMVPNSAGTLSIQKCVPCATGKYKVGAGSGNCLSCGNKPDNSEYTAWSTTVAGTLACPWSVFFLD